MILFILGAAPFLAGIIYTTTYPSTDPHVLAPLITGALFLVLFALYENLGHKAGFVPRPLTPTRVFTAGHGRDCTLFFHTKFLIVSRVRWSKG
jgi:hypothetical protein